ncbi:MAG: LytTR family transcriptional regulator DNA-binding domain-containing protein, partial [Proteobacteria bacterium]|nr:LytTR family transcriptional regulator DNA-binding domain-containing protein [Pseudomonadota bacterium]
MRLEGVDGRIGGAGWWARALTFAAVVGLLLGVIGPFGAYLNPMPMRILDQLVMTISGTVIAGLLIPILLRLAGRIGLPLFFSLAVSLLVTAVPIAGLSALVSFLIWPWNMRTYTPAKWYGEAILMLSVIFTLWVLLESARQTWRAQGGRSAAPASSAAADSLAGEAICLQTEDNYVRVHRARGSSLELMPLHEAIARFGGGDGLRVHRGWWVAASAVAGAERDARNWRLRLSNGL